MNKLYIMQISFFKFDVLIGNWFSSLLMLKINRVPNKCMRNLISNKTKDYLQ